MKRFVNKLVLVLALTVYGLSALAQSAITVSKNQVCMGEKVTFNAHLDPAYDVANVTVQDWTWDFKDGSAPVTVSTEPTEIEHTFINDFGTKNVELTIRYTKDGVAMTETKILTVEVLKAPMASYGFGPKVSVCGGQSVTLTVETYGNYVLWSNGMTNSQITLTPQDLENYNKNIKANGVPDNMLRAVVYDDNMCTALLGADPVNPNGVVTIEFYENPEIEDLGELTYDRSRDLDLQGLPVTLWINSAAGATNAPVVTWTPNETVKNLGTWDRWSLTPENTTTYTVTAKQAHEGNVVCEATRLVTVNVAVIKGNESTAFDANNVFMPGSQRNQYWVLAGENEIAWYKDCKLIIYNTWGQEVYVKETIGDVDYLWDGKSNDGDELPTDTYYYLVQCSGCGCNYTGAVSIIRK